MTDRGVSATKVRRRIGSSLFGLSLAGLGAVSLGITPGSASSVKPAETSREVFERRILPLMNAKNPSSCAECHLSGVDLKDYVRPTEAETFASLRQQGLIDAQVPDNSKILRLIRMSRPESPLLSREARGKEYAAFRSWIEAAAKNPALNSARPMGKRIGPSVSNAVIRHTRIDSVTASFERNIWSQEGRCMGCHRPGAGSEANVQKFGKQILWYVPDNPEATMRKIISRGLVNIEKPDQSLFLLKPLNKVSHGGGVKMLYGDTSYQMFRAWLEDYAASVKGKYRREQDLPATAKQSLLFTEAILEVSQTPQEWVNHNLRVDIYARRSDGTAWEKQPAATGEREVGDGRATNILIFKRIPTGLQVANEESRNKSLAPGRYLLRYYVDTSGKSGRDYTVPTDSPAFLQGEQETTAEWKPGWGSLSRVRVELRQSRREGER